MTSSPLPDTARRHPLSIWVREKPILDRIARFFTDKIFNAQRTTYLQAALADAEQQATYDHEQKIQALEHALDDIETRRSRLVRNLELTDGPNGEFTRDIQTRAAELGDEQRTKRATLAELQRTRPKTSRPELLDLLPVGSRDLTTAPEDLLRALFEAFRLEIHYDKHTNTTTCRVTLVGEAIDTQRHTAQQLLDDGTQGDDPSSVPICVVPPAGHTPDLRRRDLHVRPGNWS